VGLAETAVGVVAGGVDGGLLERWWGVDGDDSRSERSFNEPVRTDGGGRRIGVAGGNGADRDDGARARGS